MTARKTSTPTGCVVALADGTPCSNVPLVGRYCPEHEAVLLRDIEMYKLVVDHYNQDLREFWQRSNLYLLIDAGLLSIAASQPQGSFRSMLLSLFGILISLTWYLVARGSIVWIRQWRREVESVDEVVSRLGSFHRLERPVHQRPWSSPSWVTQWLPLVFLAGWIALLLSGVS
jgi:hypothetical protein